MRIAILKHLLTWFKDRLLNLECSRGVSSTVDAIDYLLEKMKHVTNIHNMS
ncbi:MAG: hypothetical protein ACUZ8H_03690 [Candidatus Anammoxibacter sp.]